MPEHSLDKSKIRFLLLEGLHESAESTIRSAGYSNIESIATSIPEAELIENIQDFHFLGIRSRTQITARVLQAARKLVGIGCFCIGTNQVDLQAAQLQGIAVFNAPYSNTRSVAELVLAEAIMLLRGIPQKNFACHRGDWQKSALGSYEARGKTLGIIGYGSIGSQVSVLAEALGMKIRFFDAVAKLPLGNAIQVKSMNELLGSADVLTLHVPENSSTRNLIGASEIRSMRPGAILINASRGHVVDLDAVAGGIATGHLAGAAIDVFPVEPKSDGEKLVSPLQGLENAILTPHIGGSTQEAQENIGAEVAAKLVRYSDNGTTIGSVNFPEVAVPEHPGTHRLLHIHRNIPGVLTSINRIFSENQLNIIAQFLQTKDQVGYVVIDVDADCSGLALEQLAEIPATIRCRVLH